MGARYNRFGKGLALPMKVLSLLAQKGGTLSKCGNFGAACHLLIALAAPFIYPTQIFSALKSSRSRPRSSNIPPIVMRWIPSWVSLKITSSGF